LAKYKKVLFLGCISDLIFGILNTLIAPDVAVIQGVRFVFTRGYLGYLPFPWTSRTYHLIVFFVYFSVVNVLIQFIYRYLLMSWGITLKTRSFGAMILLGAALIIAYCYTPWITHITRETTDEFYSDLLVGSSYEIDGKIPPFGAFVLVGFFKF
uniref:Uncharacterized protein n=1 Tax=Panagrolaimus sp. PS1159 TaxID=55785 RepID=A0AC35FFM7_9BILA